MYSGIIHDAYPVKDLVKKEGLLSFSLELPKELLEGIELGASVGVDGVCLTVAEIKRNTLSFDAMKETLTVTTLGELQEGQLVNVERSLKEGQEIGGHLVSGHVDGMVEIIDRIETPNNVTFVCAIDKHWMKYLFHKGFIAIHGASLTIGSIDKENGTFELYLIPETLKKTNFSEKQVGDFLNFEIDRQTQTIVDTTERVVQEYMQKKNL